MKVSVALHTAEIDMDGNQRQHEAQYRDYNRREAELTLDAKTTNFGTSFQLAFPVIPDGEGAQVFTHFSIGYPGRTRTVDGVTGADPDAVEGGTIIIAGPLVPPVMALEGVAPEISVVAAVFRERLNKLGLLPLTTH